MPQASSVSIDHRSGVLVACVHTKMMDETVCAQLRTALDDDAASTNGPVVVDLSDVKILPSLAIGVLLEARKKLAETGRRLIIAGAQPMVRDVLRLTRVDQILELCDTIDAAVQECRP